MPKKKVVKKAKAAVKKVVKKAVVKKAVKKAAPVKRSADAVAAKGSVGFRLRMEPGTHKQLTKMAEKAGVSQNTLLNNLIKDAK